MDTVADEQLAPLPVHVGGRAGRIAYLQRSEVEQRLAKRLGGVHDPRNGSKTVRRTADGQKKSEILPRGECRGDVEDFEDGVERDEATGREIVCAKPGAVEDQVKRDTEIGHQARKWDEGIDTVSRNSEQDLVP